MQAIQLGWNIDSTFRRRHKIDPRPPYQRGPVWSLQKRQLLMDTILRSYDIPKFYLRKLDNNSNFNHEIADGQQRLTAGDLSGQFFEQLPDSARDQVGLYQLSVVELSNTTDVEIRDLFLRLQEGVSLNPAEKRNAMIGNMRAFVANLGETHPVFPLTRISNSRYAWHNLAAIVVCLELSKGPTDVKSLDLQKLYEQNRNFDIEGSAAKKIKKSLTYMARSLQSEPPEMNIISGVCRSISSNIFLD
ncbi:MAG: DUF262 domain-containing protein [Ardenticatenia bacterium]|nr:DUF262 domain-containing protein [Ardenticatenia bacterium]